MPTIDDCWGGRWRVRARHERHAPIDTDDNRRAREPALQARLGAALAPHTDPLLPADDVPGRPSGETEGEWGRSSHVRLRLVGLESPGGLLVAIWRGIRLLNEPADSMWVVELAARGRIRRGATWQVGRSQEGRQVVSEVAAAVRLGQVPQPRSALLIDVVDERLTV